MKRPLPLRHQLILALVVPAFAVLAAMAYRADAAMRRALEDALGERLEAIAQATATAIDPRVLLLEAGDDESRIAKNAHKKLQSLIEATHVERILIARMDGTQVVLDSSGRLKVGAELARAAFDQNELDVVARGGSTASVLFQDATGRWYKSGFAPLAEPATEDAAEAVRGVVIVEAPAQFFEALGDLRSVLISIVLAGFVALIGLAVVASRGVTTSLSRLSRAAERIGAGELSTEISRAGPREAQVLAQTMQSMARSISQREEEMQVMLAGIAHEVRNPLGGIELFGGLLREDLEGDPRQKHVDKILKEIGMLGAVVNDFLDYARKRPLDRKKTDLRELVDEVVTVVRSDAEAKKLALTVEAGDRVAASLDHDCVHRAVLNLVTNAIQATPEGGRIVVRTRSADGQVVIEIEDNGPGVPESKRQDVFRPFFTTKQKGTGLGLALVKKAAEAHHGQVELADTPGGGATFRLRIPHL